MGKVNYPKSQGKNFNSARLTARDCEKYQYEFRNMPFSVLVHIKCPIPTTEKLRECA